MAQIRLSNAGGAWNSGTTWDGGSVPSAGDNILADASSGNLSLDTNRTCAYWDLTNWSGTLATSTFYLACVPPSASTVSCKFGSNNKFAVLRLF